MISGGGLVRWRGCQLQVDIEGVRQSDSQTKSSFYLGDKVVSFIPIDGLSGVRYFRTKASDISMLSTSQ